MENFRQIQSQAREKLNKLVELQHRSGDCHSARHLEAHPAEHILQVPGVGMESTFVELLGVDDLLLSCPRGLLLQPGENRKRNRIIELLMGSKFRMPNVFR